MSEKVKLPREVIEAIEHYSKSEFGYTKYGVLDCIVGEASSYSMKARSVLISAHGEGPCWDVLMEAIINGYEVEETPEERIKETFERFERSEVGREVGFAGGIKFSLNELGIKIEGINK
jgi:hypothetical protein